MDARQQKIDAAAAARQEAAQQQEAALRLQQEQTARDLDRVDAPLQALASRFLQNLYAREP